MGTLFSVIYSILSKGPIAYLFRFAKWFYLTLIPFVLQYIGIPLFALGILLPIAFAGGTVIFIIVFCIFMYKFIKGTIFNSKPSSAVQFT